MIDDKAKNRRIVVYILSVAVFTYVLGDLINIFGVKLSWIVSAFIILLFAINYKLFKRKSTNCKLRYGVIFFAVIWVLYSVITSVITLGFRFQVLTGNISLAVNAFIVVSLLLTIQTKQEIIIILKGLILGIALNAVLGIIQIVFSLNTFEESWKGLPLGVYGNPNDFATVMIIGAIAVIGKYILSKKINVFDFICIVLFVVMAVLSKSRIAQICAILIVPAFLCNYLLEIFLFKGNSRKAKIFYIVTVLVIALIFIALLYSENFASLLLNLINNNQSNLASDLYRLNILKECINVCLSSFGLGVGSGLSIPIIGINPHSLFFEILAEYGIFFFLLTVVLFGLIYKDETIKTESIFLKASVFIFFLISFASSSIFRIRVAWIFIAILLLIQICNKETDLYKKHETETAQKNENLR